MNAVERCLAASRWLRLGKAEKKRRAREAKGFWQMWDWA